MITNKQLLESWNTYNISNIEAFKLDEIQYVLFADETGNIQSLFDRNRPIATAAYAAWLSIACAIGAQFHGSNSSRRLILWSWMRSRMSAR